MDDVTSAALGLAQTDASLLRKIVTTTVKRLLVLSNAHYMSGTALQYRNTRITIALIISTTILLFFTNIDSVLVPAFSEKFNLYWRIVLGLGSALAVAGAAIQYALHHQETIIQHKTAGVNFSSIRRDLELLLILPDDELVKNVDTIRHLYERYFIIASHAPSLLNKHLCKSMKLIEDQQRSGLNLQSDSATNDNNEMSFDFSIPQNQKRK